MNIALNFKTTNGPTGGGISFVNSLVLGLVSNGHNVFFNLRNKDFRERFTPEV